MATLHPSLGTAGLLVVGCLLVSAFCSGTETGFLSASRVRLRRLAAAGDRGVAPVLELLNRMEDVVLTLLVGNNLINVLLSSLLTVTFIARYGEHGEAVAVVVAAFATAVFGEIIPKVVFREFPERLTIAAVPGLRVMMFVLAPARWLLNAYARLLQRLSGRGSAVGHALDRSGLVALLVGEEAPAAQDRHFRQALEQFLRLSGRQIAQMMRPLDDVVTVRHDATLRQVLEVAAASGFSRLPVAGPAAGQVLGYLLVRDLLFLAEEPGTDREAPVPPDVMRTILEVDGNLSPYELFEELHHRQHQLALVVDARSRPVGLLTLEDLIEKVTGSISDEFDPIAEVTT
jgi:CBS domain containing-hemolysin-like protein